LEEKYLKQKSIKLIGFMDFYSLILILILKEI